MSGTVLVTINSVVFTVFTGSSLAMQQKIYGINYMTRPLSIRQGDITQLEALSSRIARGWDLNRPISTKTVSDPIFTPFFFIAENFFQKKKDFSN